MSGLWDVGADRAIHVIEPVGIVGRDAAVVGHHDDRHGAAQAAEQFVQVVFELRIDGRTAFRSPAAPTPEARLRELFGRPFVENLWPVNHTESGITITGFTAKESVVSTLTILTGAANDAELGVLLPQMFSPLSAFSFLTFTILYMPCVAAFAASKRELGSMKEALLTAGYQTLVAYLVAMVFYQVGSLIL